MTDSTIPTGMKPCATTGLPLCPTSSRFVRYNAVLAVVSLLIGGIGALLLALTRWQAVHLLPVDWFYRILTLHGMNMLIFWILYFEVAVLYFVGTSLLRTRLFSAKIAWVAFIMMVAGQVMVEYAILAGKADVLMTSYLPLVASSWFYFGVILFAVGTLIGVGNFFGCVYQARKEKRYGQTMPLVAFGALAAAIIAVLTLLHGAIAMVPTWTFSMGWTREPDAGWYRLIWWGLGHQSQQVNVCAMVAIWYLIGNITTGAKPLNEAVCRSAFVLYILFINLASAHHLLVDPGVGAAWKIWNTSYAMYLAVLASMIHGFTVPASVEVAMRGRGYVRGLFGWVMNLPWRNPAFSGVCISVLIFGFIGGITGVTLGTQQINIIAHNTLRITGHFHATVVGGTSLAFMALTYYVIPLVFGRDYLWKPLARLQPWLFGGGILMVSLGMSFAGSLGAPRRTWDIDTSGAFGPAAHFMLGIMGIGALLAVTGLLIFIIQAVATILFGKKLDGKPMTCWGVPPVVGKAAKEPASDGATAHSTHDTRGTIILAGIFLLSFAVYYFANWKALTDVWPVR